MAVLQAAERAEEQAFLEQPSSQLNQQQAAPDSAYLQEAPLWAAYRFCAACARKKNAARTAHSNALLTASYGQKLVFGHEARANVDPKIIDRIRCCACLTLDCLGSQQHDLPYGMQTKAAETAIMQTSCHGAWSSLMSSMVSSLLSLMSFSMSLTFKLSACDIA